MSPAATSTFIVCTSPNDTNPLNPQAYNLNPTHISSSPRYLADLHRNPQPADISLLSKPPPFPPSPAHLQPHAIQSLSFSFPSHRLPLASIAYAIPSLRSGMRILRITGREPSVVCCTSPAPAPLGRAWERDARVTRRAGGRRGSRCVPVEAQRTDTRDFVRCGVIRYGTGNTSAGVVSGVQDLELRRGMQVATVPVCCIVSR